ncbi:MAG: IclR family transcriptional regulator [Hyphomicrobiaceae bacterium]
MATRRRSGPVNGKPTHPLDALQAGADDKTTSVVLRVMNLLTVVAANSGTLSVAEIAAAVSLPKPTVHRLCQQLEASGYFMRDPATRHYGVGHRLWDMGLNIVNTGLQPERHAILQKLVNEIGETCNLSMRVRDQSIYIDRVESRWPLRLNLEPGSTVPLHCTASGKIFLSAMPKDRRQRLLSITGLPAHTSKTITDLGRMEEEVERIKKRGYSIDNEEFLEGLVALAVPVRNSQGAIIAGIACHGPKPRLTVEEALKHLPLLNRAATELRSSFDRGDAEESWVSSRGASPPKGAARKQRLKG